MAQRGQTTLDAGHVHIYEVDGNGNGWATTAYHPNSNEINHNHKIVNWVIQSNQSSCHPNCKQIYGYEGSPPHTHSIPTVRRGGGKITFQSKPIRNKQLSQGGMLVGPSHENGGIQAIVDGTEPIEVEGGEFVINKPTVDALGEDFLHKLNSTATPYHNGGFSPGELPLPSNFKKGGKINKPRPKQRKLQIGGSTCPPGQNFYNGVCTPEIIVKEEMYTSGTGFHTGFKKGGQIKPKIKNKGTNSRGPLKGSRTNIKKYRKGGQTKVSNHHTHALNVDPLTGNGHTKVVNGHSHSVVNGQIQMYCDGDGNCHTHTR